MSTAKEPINEKSDVVKLLVDTTANEFCKSDNREFLTEIVRFGFLEFTKMSERRLEQNLVFWGIKDCLAGDDSLDADNSQINDECDLVTIRSGRIAVPPIARMSLLSDVHLVAKSVQSITDPPHCLNQILLTRGLERSA